MKYRMFTDGGSRGNPGPGAIGVVIKNESGETVFELAKYLGICTNNEAEYAALIAGLNSAKNKQITDLECFLDSELVVNQLKGLYKVKNERLAKLHTLIGQLKSNFSNLTFTHVERKLNKEADALVNSALDKNDK